MRMKNIAMLLAGYAVVITTLLFTMMTPEDLSSRSKRHPRCPPCNLLHTGTEMHKVVTIPNNPVRTVGTHKLGVVVPYRNRMAELLEFVPHLYQYLTKKGIVFEILVIDQFDTLRFNRGALIDIGFLLARRSGCDYMAMHDVDLLPLNPELNYGYPKDGPFHVAAPHLHPKYHYKTFIGGIVLMTNDDFEKVNGLSTRYWGWGREDDELYKRFADAHLKVVRPGNLTTGVTNTFRHVHNDKLRKRDYKRVGKQQQDQWKRDKVTGLSTIAKQHRVVHKNRMSIGESDFTLVNVQLICDKAETPWCEL